MLGTSYADSRRLEAALLVRDILNCTVVPHFGALSGKAR